MDESEASSQPLRKGKLTANPSNETSPDTIQTTEGYPASATTGPTIDYGPRPPLGFHIQVYLSSSVDADSLLFAVENGAEHKKKEEFVCKAYSLAVEPESLIEHAAKQHPVQCSKHPTLHNKLFIVADALSYKQDGVSVVQIDWDGRTDTRNQDELRDIGERLHFKSQKAPVSGYDTEFAVPRLCGIAHGSRKWEPEHWRFLAYTLAYPDCDIKLLLAIDSRWSRRRENEDRAFIGGSFQADVMSDSNSFWPAMIRTHVQRCRRDFKFTQKLSQEFIICGDTADPESGVMLICLEWDRFEGPADDLVRRYRELVTYCRRPARVAYQELVDVVEGKAAWRGDRLEA